MANNAKPVGFWESTIVVLLRLVSVAILLSIIFFICWGCLSLWYCNASWRAEQESRAYIIESNHVAVAKRNAALIESGKAVLSKSGMVVLMPPAPVTTPATVTTPQGAMSEVSNG